MSIEDSLLANGMPEREAKVYLALLELGEASVLRVAQTSGIERTYCYDILESLIKNGMATRMEIAGKQRYVGESPDTLAYIFEQRASKFKKSLPELRSRYNSGGQKPVVRFYEGKESLEKIYNELENCVRYDAITSPAALYKMQGTWVNEVAARLVKKGIKVRELVSAEMGMPEFGRIFRAPLQEVRVLPSNVLLSTDTLIYENKVVSISYAPVYHAVVTEGSGIVTTQKALFEYMWNATPR